VTLRTSFGLDPKHAENCRSTRLRSIAQPLWKSLLNPGRIMTIQRVKKSALGCLLAALFLIPAAGALAQDGGVESDGGNADSGMTASDAGMPASDAGMFTADAGMSTADAGEPEPEGEWMCEPAYYDAADGCDCECGIPDPDCQLANQPLYGCPAAAEGCTVDGYCEIPGCGDGTFNEETELCDDGNSEAGDGCSPGCQPEPGWSCSADPTACIQVPAEWKGTEGPFCSDSRYGDGEFCDCGCGVVDADCESATAECDGLFLGCIPENAVNFFGEVDMSVVTMVPDTADNTQCVDNVCGDTHVAGTEECDDGNSESGDGCDASCVVEAPEGWTCDPRHYIDDVCDCGCGAEDPACPDLALDPAMDCTFDECRGPDNVDPADHSQCLNTDYFTGDDPKDDDGDDGDDGDDDDSSCSSVKVKRGWPVASLALLFGLALLTTRRRRLPL
jgi:cysteine-rich repeat protein